MPKMSVIVVIPNQESKLELCLKSVLTQTFSDFELLLVNAGSTVKNEKICDRYKKQDTRISVIHTEDSDMGTARNAGISHSSGEFITFIDCNDFLHEQMLTVLHDQIVSTKTDIALCDFQPIEEQEAINESRRLNPLRNYNVTTCSGIEALHGLYDTDRLYSVPWSKLYRKELFNDINYPEGYVDDDEFVAHKLLYQASGVVYVHEPLYYYVVGEGRKGSIKPIPMTIEKFDKVLALYERVLFFKEKKLRDVEERALLHFSEHFFWYYLQSQKELPEATARRKEIKKLFNRLFFRIVNNSQLTNTKKIVYSVFRLSPPLHKFLISSIRSKGG